MIKISQNINQLKRSLSIDSFLISNEKYKRIRHKRSADNWQLEKNSLLKITIAIIPNLSLGVKI